VVRLPDTPAWCDCPAGRQGPCQGKSVQAQQAARLLPTAYLPVLAAHCLLPTACCTMPQACLRTANRTGAAWRSAPGACA
jgi:hypothetical protein